MVEVRFVGTKPVYAHPGDAGADLQAYGDYVIGHGVSTLVHTGTSVQIPTGYVGLVFPRSGYGTKFGLSLANTVGVIDAGYTGEILLHMTLNREGSLSVRSGDRIAQLVIVPVVSATFVEVDSLGDTERGDKGFGSSG